jgi:hypothetical protein
MGNRVIKTWNRADGNNVNARRHMIAVSLWFRHKFTDVQRPIERSPWGALKRVCVFFRWQSIVDADELAPPGNSSLSFP